MSTLIIRDLNDQLAEELKREAKKRALSVNRFLHQIVEAALREARRPDVLSVPKAEHRLQVRNNSAQFAGGWTQQDYDEFVENTRDFSAIDPEMWK